MLFGTMKVNEKYHLEIGGKDVVDLVQEHGSPLYVYDQSHIENMIDLFQENFKSEVFNARVAYASKAFLSKAMVQLLSKKNMSLDCVSGGEMYTAKAASFDMSKTIIHGNNKSNQELNMCFDLEVGYIVVDNIDELNEIILMAKEKRQNIKTIFRVNPGIEAHTHEYIITAKLTSKFGESIFDDKVIKRIIKLYGDSEYVSLEGFHCHIGSQIFNEDAFINTIDVMTDFIKKTETIYNISIPVLNIGGGFGVYYVDGDRPVNLEYLLKKLIIEAEKAIKEKGINLKELIIEPGRAIVSNAGTTLYKIGSKKDTYGGKNYLFVDGGMTDNIRPALYQAKYSSDIATKMNDKKNTKVTVAGKLCESGDLLINDTKLQSFEKGDILAIYTTGAYNYSMASNYNKILKPAVIFVKNGISKEVIKRETFEDLLRNDLDL